MERVKRTGRVLKYRGAILDFYEDQMELPDGTSAYWDYVEHRNGAAAVLPVRDDGKIFLVRQYRNALNEEMLEIPAGAKNEKNEPSVECAARELEEEIGYRPGHLEKLICVSTTVAFCNETIDVFLATNLIPSVQHLDAEEFLEVEVYDLEELCDMIYAGKIKDAKTVAAILAYKNKVGKFEK